MTITAKVIADSISPQGIRLTTMQLRYPKCFHGEAKTHRQLRIADRAYELLEEVGFMDDPNLSRNASSSRAIPVRRLIQDVLDDPYIPSYWGKNKPGMQADEECDEPVLALDCVTDTFGDDGNFEIMGNGQLWSAGRVEAWLVARNHAINAAWHFAEAGYHKQIVNRLIEPWCHINVVVTATEWSNFFALRDHADAQPEIRILAQSMKDAMASSTPTLLQSGEWHTPYVGPLKEDISMRVYDLDGDALKKAWEQAIKVSVARCARVSYLTQDGRTPTIDEDLALYDKLVGNQPIHASPAEHQATPDELCTVGVFSGEWKEKEKQGNLRGWIQYRKTLPGECQ